MAAKPLIMTPVPRADIERGSGALANQFIQGFCHHTKDGIAAGAGTLISLRDWQQNIPSHIFARRPDKRYRHRQALIGLPRKNGKSEIGSGLGLYGLVMGGQGAEVYSAAADKEQARIVFGVAKKMVEMSEELSGMIKPYRDALELTQTGSIYKVLSSEAFTKEGLNPTTIVYDELHAAPNPDLYNVLSLAAGARRDPLLIAITTAGSKYDQTGQESICYTLYQHGEAIAKGEEEDDTFFMAWWGAPKGADHTDPKVHEAANPGYGDFLDPEDFTSTLKRIPENEFRTKRLNQWVSSSVAWLPAGAWNACFDPEFAFVPGRMGVVLGFDGSFSGDSTALIAVTVDQQPAIKVLGLWEKPPDDDNWRVPRAQVKDAIRQACRDWDVREIAWDEYLWLDAAEELEEEGLPVVIFPQRLTSMLPATQRFFEHVVTNKTIRHNGDPRLARHLDNAVLKTDTRGARLVKDAKNSPRKIDLAVASVMGVDRAGFWLTQPGPETYVWKDAEGATHSKPVEEIGFVW